MSSPLLLAGNTPPDASALAYASVLVAAAYGGSLESSVRFPTSGIVEISSDPFPRAWTWIESGSRIVLINGTTAIRDDGGQQWLGWQAPTVFAGGRINAWYRTVAVAISTALPVGADIVIGQSMGGAIACELTQILRGGISPNCICLTLAAPRGRDIIGAAGYGTWLTRVNYEHDPVPYLPGSIPLGNDWRLGGRVYLFDANGKLRIGQDDYSDVATATSLLARWLPIRGHDTSTYSVALAMAIAPPVSGVQIAYVPQPIDP
jgi:hypothetical protein